MVAGARKPARRERRGVQARRRPPSPGWRRLVQAPSARNSIEPRRPGCRRCRARGRGRRRRGRGAGRPPPPRRTRRRSRWDGSRARSARPAAAPSRGARRPRSRRRRRAAAASPLAAGELGGRERGREDARAEVDRAALVRVVHLERVRGGAVGERGVRRGQTLAGAEHTRVAGAAETARGPGAAATLDSSTAPPSATPRKSRSSVARAAEHRGRQLGVRSATTSSPRAARERARRHVVLRRARGGHVTRASARAVPRARRRRGAARRRARAATRDAGRRWSRQTPVARPAR